MAGRQWGPPSGSYPTPGTSAGPYPAPDARAQPGYASQYHGWPVGGTRPPQGYPAPQPGFGWGVQFTAPPTPPKPPRRTGLVVALTLLGVLVVGIAAIAGLAVRDDDPVVSEPSPTARSTTEPTATISVPPIPTLPPSVGPTATITQPEPPPSTPTTPPPPSSREIVTRDRFYAAGAMASVGCHEPGARPASRAGAAAYYQGLLSCLNRAWPRNVRAGGDFFRAPRLLLVARGVQSPCNSGGGLPDVSFYCGLNETIYMRYDQDVMRYNSYPQAGQRTFARMWAMFTVAHEYGHHVQNLTGILGAQRRLQYAAPSSSERLETSRRTELQASCLGSLFVGANRRSLPMNGESSRQWWWAMTHTLDPRHDHGNSRNHGLWTRRGYDSRNPASCNTFVASSRAVG